MSSIKLKVEMKDKKTLFPLKGKYDPDTRILKIYRGFSRAWATNFNVNPDHIYTRMKRRNRTEYAVYIDVTTRSSIPLETDSTKSDIDGKMKNTLNYLIEEKWWRSIIAKQKLPLSTIAILLTAGGGIFYLIRDIILPIFGAAMA